MLQLITLIVGLISGTWLSGKSLLWVFIATSLSVFFVVVVRHRVSVPYFSVSVQQRCLLFVLLWWLAAGYSYSWLSWQLMHRLSTEHDQMVVQVDGDIEQVQSTELGQRILIRVANLATEKPLAYVPRRVQLNHYQRGANAEVSFQAGDVVHLQAVLRSPRNFANGLPFDYEAFLLTEGIDATGYVQSVHDQQVTGEVRWRQRWLAHLQQHRDALVWPWIAGLVFAEQGAFSDDIWQLTQASGTVHLLVVSGLHVGWVALLGMLFGRLLFRVSAFISQRTPPCVACWSMFGLMIALAGYWSVAQPGVSLQRATWMLVFVAFYTLWLRRVSPSNILLAAAAVMLCVNPLLYTRTGFVFSVLAVWALLQFFDGRRSAHVSLIWWPQWVVFAGLMPVMLWWQNPVNLGHLLANAVAIPWLTFVMLPSVFLHTLLDISWLADVVRWNAQGFLQLQQSFQTIQWPVLGWQSPLVLGLWWLWLWLLTRGVNAVFAIVGTTIIVMLWWRTSVYPLPFTDPNVTFIDVGQGLSVIATGTTMHSHRQQGLVYDVGPRFSARFDAGSGMVLPLLQRQRIQHAHSVIVSHNHADHYGGAHSLIAGIPVQRVWQGQALRTPLQRADQTHRDWQLCHDHSAWQVLSNDWRFRFFPIESRWRNRTNNHSCVLLLEWYGIRLLFMGDLEQDAELWLVANYGSALQADVLVLGHHGSRTSTSDALLTVVMPQQAWISAGFNNRFQHPHDDVLERLERHGIEWYSTANEGALRLTPRAGLQRQRQLPSPPWRQR